MFNCLVIFSKGLDEKVYKFPCPVNSSAQSILLVCLTKHREMADAIFENNPNVQSQAYVQGGADQFQKIFAGAELYNLADDVYPSSN